MNTPGGQIRKNGSNYENVYSISDHLGNVRVTYTESGTGNGVTILSFNDYYAWGGTLPGRGYVNTSYRYGYQGQEKPEDGTLWDQFELRLFNHDLGRWFAPDPYSQYHSPYLAMGNNPINGIDPDGGYSTQFSFGESNANHSQYRYMMARWQFFGGENPLLGGDIGESDPQSEHSFALYWQIENAQHFGFLPHGRTWSDVLEGDLEEDARDAMRDMERKQAQYDQSPVDESKWDQERRARIQERLDKWQYERERDELVKNQMEMVKDFTAWQQEKQMQIMDQQTLMMKLGYKIGKGIIEGAVTTHTRTPNEECEKLMRRKQVNNGKFHKGKKFKLRNFHLSYGVRIGNTVLVDIRINSTTNSKWVENFPGRSWWKWNKDGKGIDNTWRFNILPYRVWRNNRQSYYPDVFTKQHYIFGGYTWFKECQGDVRSHKR